MCREQGREVASIAEAREQLGLRHLPPPGKGEGRGGGETT